MNYSVSFSYEGKKTQHLSLCCYNKIYEKRKLKKNKKLFSPRAGDWPLRRTARLHHHMAEGRTASAWENPPLGLKLFPGVPAPARRALPQAMITFKVLKLHYFHCWNKIPEKKPLREWRTYSGPSWQQGYPSCQVVTASVVRKQSETDVVALLAFAVWFYSVGDPGF